MKHKNRIIYTSKNYSEFVQHEKNRDPKGEWVGDRFIVRHPRLRSNMTTLGWDPGCPMHVILRDGKKVIKDGQHRYHLAIELGLPLQYIITEDNGLDASDLSISLPWSLTDHVKCYAKQGKGDYQKLLAFKDETGLPLSTCCLLLMGHSQHANAVRAAKIGAFTVKDEAHARAVVAIIHAAAQHVKWAQHSYFVAAASQAVTHAKIDIGTMCDRIRAHPTLLVNGATVSDFVAMLEKVYNYRNRAPIAIAHLVKEGVKRQWAVNAGHAPKQEA